MDRSAVRRIVDALALSTGETVIEIGPGRGALTRRILERSSRVAAVEIDETLADGLERALGHEGLRIIREDVLRLDWTSLAPRIGVPPGTTFVVAGNLPYAISKPVAQKLVAARGHVSRAVLMFQREVAARLTAKPGTRSYGPLTVWVDRAYAVRRLFDLPPGAFRPRPAVVSTVTAWARRPASEMDPAIEGPLRACLLASFRRRRQTLFNNLRNALPGKDTEARRLLERTGLDPDARAETIPPSGFLRLAAVWPDPSP